MSQDRVQMAQSNELNCRNYTDEHGNPSGGYAHGPGLCVEFQDGPRGKDAGGNLAPANGAFVEDLLVAARQRLAFFQRSRFAHNANANAMMHIEHALRALEERANERSGRGVLGSNEP
jgi:hypothetical protein